MDETSAFSALSVFIAYHPRSSVSAIINQCAARFGDAGNASVICAVAIQAGGFDLLRLGVLHSGPCQEEGRRLRAITRWSTLSGLRQGIRKEDFDRVALVGAVAATAGIEIATLFKLIELALRY
jgi:hypothetical protein